MRFTALKYASLPLALLLGGCFSNEPDADDILAAVRQSRAVKEKLMLSFPGANFSNPSSLQGTADSALKGAKVEKFGCTQPPPGMAGLICEYRIGLNSGGQLHWQKDAQRFIKLNGAWQTGV